MSNPILKVLLFQISFTLLFLLAAFPLMATHNRAGDITVEQIGGCNSLTIRATITTYTKASSIAADRDTLTICWGDGNCEKIARSNGNGELLGNDTKLNYYEGLHTYAGRGTYRISMTDPNRIDNIVNINNGRSVQVPFYIETVYTFLNPQFQGCNSTPVLLQPPIDVGCVGQVFRHNPNAHDPDNDSLAYRLIVPYQTENEPVPNYQYPNQINPGPNNLITLNEVNGDFTWFTPQFPGDYNIAILIISYRNGFPIDTVLRDMQITIQECDNLPPEIEPIQDICVVAGELIEFPVIATAPRSDANQKVEIKAFGGPLIVDDPAEFIVDAGFREQPLQGIFRWQTTCNHISDQYYSVIFRAADNFPILMNNQGSIDTSYLSTLQSVRIKVVGPAPEDLQAETAPGTVRLSWESPYSCEGAKDNYFYGFSVWRRIGSNSFPPDTCNPGLDGRGYSEIAFRTIDLQNGRYVFVDTDVERGRTYCYRVLGRFAKTTTSGQPYNLVESLPSQEVCIQLNRDIPLITNVDILSTDPIGGNLEVRWSKPKPGDLDTLENPGPYTYQVLRAPGISQTGFSPVPGAVFESQYFANANDTTWQDATGINTATSPWSYEIAFYVNGESVPLGTTEPASSVFLKIRSTDNRNILSWESSVPWENQEYVVFRQDPASSQFDSLTTVAEESYSDVNLVNGQEYCYFIQSIGSYGVSGVVNPIVNHSQIACGVPLDTIPPCSPQISISNFCDSEDPESDPITFENLLRWNNPINTCPETDDVIRYDVYFALHEGEVFQRIAEITDPSDTTFVHGPLEELAGCYYITAVDSFGNESSPPLISCTDNCPLYDLPNAFTPNGDGQNDIFRPFSDRFIEKVEFQVFNRWGNQVFRTSDPKINWDGTDQRGNQLSDGVYQYLCKIFERRLDGIREVPEIKKGFIELIRAN